MSTTIESLLSKHVYVGTSSWKYEGWKDFIYRTPYKSEKAFAETCLAEYATHYHTVGIDHTYSE